MYLQYKDYLPSVTGTSRIACIPNGFWFSPAGIQKLVLAGRVGEAIEATQQLYPGLLEHNPNLLFTLKWVHPNTTCPVKQCKSWNTKRMWSGSQSRSENMSPVRVMGVANWDLTRTRQKQEMVSLSVESYATSYWCFTASLSWQLFSPRSYGIWGTSHFPKLVGRLKRKSILGIPDSQKLLLVSSHFFKTWMWGV